MKKLFFVLSFLAFVPAVQAQMDCEEVPSCAELGYTQDSCAGGKGVRCPFDESKFYCSGVKQLPDAENPGVTDENWSAECADKINYCTAYNNDCQCTACEDTYLVSDGACVPECDKSVDICAAENKTFNSANCVCEACPTNYQFNSETKACEQIACDKTKVEHCATYDSEYEPCNCQTCETNYLLVDGVCKKMCTKVENCTAYDSEYDPCNCTACEDGYIFENGACVVDPCVEKCKIAYPLFAGQDNTNAVIDQIGNQALAAYAAHRFYVGDKNGDFGQGKWYLPSIGEWMYSYGTDVAQMTAGMGTTGSVGENQSLIDNALKALSSKGVNAEVSNQVYWSSSEYDKQSSGYHGEQSWLFLTNNGVQNGYRNKTSKVSFSMALRCFLFLKDCFNPSTGGTAPQIGDVMYYDKTYGSAADYDGSKVPVGIVSSVSKNGRDVTIVNLKDLTFSSDRSAGNFDPDNPYSGSFKGTYWSTSYKYSEDITGIQDFDEDQLLSAAQASDNCPCQFYKPTCTLNAETCATQGKTFNNISCACEACPSGYLFDSEVNECREACRKDIRNCSEYDSEWADCKCSACYESFDGYLFEGSCRENYCHTYADMCDVDYCKQCASETECAVCARGFTLKDNKCVYSADECVPGMVLYDDFNCYDPDNFPSDRTPIGIIYKAGDDGRGRLLALSLDEITLPWSKNLATIKTGCTGADDRSDADCIIAAGAEENSAAVYCSKYGVTDSDKGKWYLPAAREVMTMIGQDVHIACLFDTLALKFGSKIVLGGHSDIGSLMTSTELNATKCSSVQRGSGTYHMEKKEKHMRFRCVIDYSNGSGCPLIEHCRVYRADCSCRLCGDIHHYDVDYELSDDGLSCIAQ